MSQPRSRESRESRERYLVGAVLAYPEMAAMVSVRPRSEPWKSAMEAVFGLGLAAASPGEVISGADLAVKAGLSFDALTTLPVPATTAMAESWIRQAQDELLALAVVDELTGAIRAWRESRGEIRGEVGGHALIRDVVARMQALAEGAGWSDEWQTLADCLAAFERFQRELPEDEQMAGGLDCGLRLHRFTGGFGPGHLVVIAGETGHGKTTLAHQFAFRMAEMGRRGGIWTKEMSAEDVGLRVANRLLGMPVWNRAFAGGMMEQLDKARRDTLEMIYYRQWSNLTSDAIYREVTHAVRNLGCAYAIIDNLKNIDEFSGRKQFEYLTDATKMLKRLAGELAIPVVALHHLNRETNWRGDPSLHWLRGSGEIAEEADSVIYIERTTPMDATGAETTGTGRIWILKARHGQAGQQCEVRIDPRDQEYEDVLIGDPPPYDP